MSKVPGTFKNAPPIPARAQSANAMMVEGMAIEAGALVAECWVVGECSVICAREPLGGEYRWHVSISHPDRYPSWDEIKVAVFGIPTIKLREGSTFAQLLGDPKQLAEGWVNRHDNCFHLYEIANPLR